MGVNFIFNLLIIKFISILNYDIQIIIQGIFLILLFAIINTILNFKINKIDCHVIKKYIFIR